MPRYSATFIVIIIMLCFGIFFGIELATRGMANIQGPSSGYTPPPEPTGAKSGSPSAPLSGGGEEAATKTIVPPPATTGGKAGGGAPSPAGSATGETAPAAQPRPQPIVVDSGINRVGNQIGDMLQTVAHGTIRTIVSLLDSLVE